MRLPFFIAGFISISLCQAQFLPSFPSENLESIQVDTTLKGSPFSIDVSTKNYDRAKSKLIEDELSMTYSIENGRYSEVDFYQNGERFLNYVYDELGRISNQERFSGFLARTDYHYDDESLVATEINYRQNGQVHSKVVIEYNRRFLPVKKIEYQGGNDLKHFWTYSYNVDGELTRESYFDSKGNAVDQTAFVNKSLGSSGSKAVEVYHNQMLQQRSEYKHYEDSTTRKTIIYEQGGVPVELKFELIADSLRVDIKGFFEQGDTSKFRSRFREIYLYDDLIEYESRTISGTKVERYTTFYKYDQKHNWIMKITYQNGIAIREESRNIYY